MINSNLGIDSQRMSLLRCWSAMTLIVALASSTPAIAQIDRDADGIADTLEVKGFICLDSNEIVPIPNTIPATARGPYWTDNDKWSTDGDPYGDAEEACASIEDAWVTPPFSDPFVAARPELRVFLDSILVTVRGRITDSENRVLSDQTTISNAVINVESFDASGGVTGGPSFEFQKGQPRKTTAGASVTGQVGYSNTTTTVNKKVNTQYAEFGWSQARSFEQEHAADVKLCLHFENRGTAAILDPGVRYSVALGGRTLFTIKDETSASGVVLFPGEGGRRYPDVGCLISSTVPFSFPELVALQSGANLTIRPIHIFGKVKRWDRESLEWESDAAQWNLFVSNQEGLDARISIKDGLEPVTLYAVRAGHKAQGLVTLGDALETLTVCKDNTTCNSDHDYEPILKFDNGGTPRLLGGVFGPEPDGEWYLSTSDELFLDNYSTQCAANEGVRCALGLEIDNNHDYLLQRPQQLLPEVTFATYSPEMRNVFAWVTPSAGFAISKVEAVVPTHEGQLTVPLVRNPTRSYYEVPDSVSSRLLRGGKIIVTDIRGVSSTEDIRLSAIDANCDDVKNRGLLENGEYLLFADGDPNRPWLGYCFFVDEDGTVLDPPVTSFFVSRSEGIPRDLGYWPNTTSGIDRDRASAVHFVDEQVGFAAIRVLDDNGFPRKVTEYLLRTTDGGRRWNEIESLPWDFESWDTRPVVSIASSSDGTEVVAVGGDPQGGAEPAVPRILYSDNGGEHFTPETAIHDDPECANRIWFSDVVFAERGEVSAAIVIGSAGSPPYCPSVFVRSPSTEKWLLRTLPHLDSFEWLSGRVLATNNDWAIAISSEGTVMRSRLPFFNWERSASDIRRATDVEFIGSSSTVVAITGLCELWRSDDAGRTWNLAANLYDGQHQCIDVDFTDNDHGVVLASGSEIMYTSNGGYNWKYTRPDTLIGTISRMDMLTAETGYFVGYKGAFVTYSRFGDPVPVGVGVDEGTEPRLIGQDGFRLQSYPNPASRSTAFRFQLNAASRVSLVVYDILGREVARVADNVHLPGSHLLRFDASDLASGVYVYTLRADDRVESKKMVIVR